MRIKRIILRVSVFLLLFLLVATVLSRTIYRLLLPQVNVAAVRTGALNNEVTFRSAIGLPLVVEAAEAPAVSEAPAEEEAPGPRFAADASVAFDELQTLLSPDFKLTGSAELLSGEGTKVDVSLSSYDYDAVSGRFTARFAVAGRDDPIEPGLPLLITVKPVEKEETSLVPLGAVFPDYAATSPQYCVYGLSERKTMWGKETYVQKITVELGDSDFQSVAVEFTGAAPPKQVVCYPTRPLSDGDAVTVKKAS
jgi:hypothetical protein